MSNYYVLLSKQEKQPRNPLLLSNLACSKLAEILRKFGEDTALDFETSGLDPFQPGSYIRAVSLANSEVSVAIDIQSLGYLERSFFWGWAAKHPGFLLFNASFDAMWAQVHGKPIKFKVCVASLFRHMSTDGWAGQRWALKPTGTELLGWDIDHKSELAEWLDSNNFKDKDMHLAPWEILGYYAALDADATYQLYMYLREAMTKLPSEVADVLWEYNTGEVNTEIQLLIEQQIEGMTINLTKLKAYSDSLNTQIDAARQEFLHQPTVVEIIEQLRSQRIEELKQLPIEQFTKTGTVAKRWENNQNKIKELSEALPEELFNIDSPQQLAWMMYEKLGYKVNRSTEGGSASVDNKALPYFDQYGKILGRYRKLRDKLKFATATFNVQIDGTLHPSLTMSRTVTGRLGGGNEG